MSNWKIAVYSGLFNQIPYLSNESEFDLTPESEKSRTLSFPFVSKTF